MIMKLRWPDRQKMVILYYNYLDPKTLNRSSAAQKIYSTFLKLFMFGIMVEYLTFLRNHTQNTDHTHFELVQN